jgi:phosphate transport system protein
MMDEEVTETRKQFHEELDELAQAVIRLAAMATEAIPRATAVLLDGDLDGLRR